MNKAYLFIAFLILLVRCKQNETTTDNTVPEPIVANVETTSVQSFSGTSSLEYSGLVEAKEITPLSFKTLGSVVQILVEEGQFVKKGQLLAKLDDTNAQSSYELALQSQSQAQDAYNRMKPMKENGTLPEIQWVEVKTGLNQARIAAEMAQRRISDNNLYAPKSGVIGNKNIQPGMNVMPSVSAFDLMDINNVYVNIPVPEKEVGHMKIGQEATVNIAATSQSVSGTIHRIGVAANTISHTYPVKILVNNKGWNIKPGMVCNVSVNTKKTHEGLVVSSKALQLNPKGEQYVYLVQDDVVKSTVVKVENLTSNKAEISGLNEGDVVVVSGQEKLRNGAQINIINKN